MTTILLIRHASTDDVGRRLSGRAPGTHLNDRGVAEARHLADRLEAVPLAAIYCSPLERARDTAQPIARTRSLSIREQLDLIELDFGEWTGRDIDSLRADPAWQQFNSHRSGTRIPGGETLLEVQARVVKALTDLHGVHDGENVAVVTHADVIRAALAYFAGMPIDLSLRLDIAPASVSIVRLSSYPPVVLTINDCGLQLISGSQC